MPRHLFLKLANPEFPHNSEHETIFYNRLVPLMQQANWPGGFPFARCLDAAWSPELKLNHLLLEDLAETHFTIDLHVPPTPEAAERLIDVYAAFHAFWWEHPSLGVDVGLHTFWQDHPTLPIKVGSFLTDEIIDSFETDARAQVEYLADKYQSDLSPEQFALVQRAVTAWPKRRRERVVQHKGVTLVHRDPHPGNIFYPRDPATHSIKLIDWQSWRIDPGTDDLAYLMAFHWPADARAGLEESLLRRYHERLVDYGVPDYSWDDCVYDYRASIIRFLSIMTIHWRNQANRDRLKLGVQAFLDWDCEQII